ncbi:MAG: TolC family protein [Bacteroidales bacterium]|nr:TolC family protein [Bacteroidales bacterium]
MSKTILRMSLMVAGLLIQTLLFSQENLLESYIREGFQNNQSLKQKQLNYNKSLAALNQSKALFYPNIGFNARYTVADGGRTIDFPIGDLLNPVYSTLNQLTQSQQFPSVENEKIYFIRPTEQETMLSLYQPLFNSDIYFQYKIRKDLSNAAYIGIDLYKRELVKEIKTAYFNYLKTVKALELFEKTLDVVRENLRVSESLVANDKVTVDAVYRSRAEQSKVERQMAEAEKFHESAKAYFNFLLNKPLESYIDIKYNNVLIDSILLNTDEAIATALGNREELMQLGEYMSASEHAIKLNKFNHTPTLNLGVNYGIQGTSYEFNDKADFLMASVVMQWKIFHGLETRSKIQQASIEQIILQEQNSELKNQISMQVIDAWYGEKAAAKAVSAARIQSSSATKAFEIIRKKYNQGQTSLLEFINVRTDMTNADLNLILASYDYEISRAELERAVGTYPIN